MAAFSRQEIGSGSKAAAPTVPDNRVKNGPLARLMRNRLAMAGLVVLVIVLLMGAFAPIIAPHDPNAQDVAQKLAMPSAAHPLGTDQLGRDTLSRLIFGIRTSLFSALVVTLVILAIGVALGIIAGYAGGVVDAFIMRMADVASTFPSSLVALAIVGIAGPSLINLIYVFIVLWWSPFARIVRSAVIKLKQADFMMAARAAGCSPLSIVAHHVLPNVLAPLIVYSTLRVAAVIAHIAAFSFVGLGSQPPTADWGVMLNDARQFMATHPEQLLWPMIAIAVVVFACNLFGEGLNDALSPVEEGPVSETPVSSAGSVTAHAKGRS